MTDAAGISRILTLVFTDLAESTALKAQRGDRAVGDLIARQPNLSLEMIQRGLGVSRPEVDARRNAALRQAGLE